jgi:hypothetical protein
MERSISKLLLSETHPHVFFPWPSGNGVISHRMRVQSLDLPCPGRNRNCRKKCLPHVQALFNLLTHSAWRVWHPIFGQLKADVVQRQLCGLFGQMASFSSKFHQSEFGVQSEHIMLHKFINLAGFLTKFQQTPHQFKCHPCLV